MKRLYVGGLSHTISEKDLRDRFGKFGEVSDVEIITRKDENGSPLKTFGYININTSDSEYKRCMTVLNKSKWKGGTLQIELAKESFLHRLAEERQKAAEKAHTPITDPQDKLVKSFKAAGVENFHMKAAVPGTEIPGHKNWVVSKFGRVLPVLHLKCEGKNKVIKCDPSKHCHNIKKLDMDEGVITPVSKLTWQVDGGYDEISKKRRGEFPPQKKYPKKIKTDPAIYDLAEIISEKSSPAKILGREINSAKKSVRGWDSDVDSDDEIRMLVAQERSRTLKTASTEENEDNLEVVGDDFVVKSDMFWGGENGLRAQVSLKSKDDDEYDSADTDEILTKTKTPSKAKELMKFGKNLVNHGGVKKVKKKAGDSPQPDRESDNSANSDEADNKDESSSESVESEYEAMMGNCYRLDLSLADLESLAKNAEEASDNEGSDDSVSEPEIQPERSSSTSEKNISKAASKKAGHNPEDILAYLFGPDVDSKENKKKAQVKPSTSSLPAFIGTKDLFASSTATLASGLKRPADRLDSGSGEEPKRLKEGSRTSQKNSKDEPSKPSELRDFKKSASVDPKLENNVQSSDSSSLESSPSSEEMDGSKDSASKYQRVTIPSPQVDCSSTNSSRAVNNDEDAECISTGLTSKILNAKPATNACSSSSDSLSAEDSETSDEEEEDDEDKEDEQDKEEANVAEPKIIKKTDIAGFKQAHDNAASRTRPSPLSVPDAVKQQQDNEKRLAAVEERMKEAEQQKKLIQGALSKLDDPKANKGKHIVFDSDDEVSDDGETATPQIKKSLFADESDDEGGDGSVEKGSLKQKESKKVGGNKLFDSSEDEDDDDDVAEDDRFQIKPQFEGKAGQKLMELQSRFGTDPRFQLDARFLEDDGQAEQQDVGAKVSEEQELDDEKKKNLAILQSVVNICIQPRTSKEFTKGKTFRDMTSLHYDPTSEAHSAFEKKTEKPEKESKAARRKKREEAMKLPEVSKEIYYDVASNLKEVFGTTTKKPDEKEELAWDKEEDEHEDEETGQDAQLLSGLSKSEEDSSSGFKFSFFGDDSTAETPKKIDEYKIETLKGAKVSWQVDPRFQDSSSDEEDAEEEEKKEEENTDQLASTSTAAVEPTTRKTFFFYEGDIRLIEGPRLFCRRQRLEETRQAWEEVRTQLRQDVRKIHRDAVRQNRVRVKN
uniref:Nucleolar protein 8 n=1 Tax=Astyanax mexicanus TaxID=7994 RepID=A0A8B9R2W9_ASTMX